MTNGVWGRLCQVSSFCCLKHLPVGWEKHGPGENCLKCFLSPGAVGSGEPGGPTAAAKHPLLQHRYQPHSQYVDFNDLY